MSSVTEKQPPSQRGGRSCTILVVQDILSRVTAHQDRAKDVCLDLAARDAMGFKKHKQNLETFDKRDTGMDAYQELLDAAQYLRKLIEERFDLGLPMNPGLEQCYTNVIDSLFHMREYLDKNGDIRTHYMEEKP